MASNIRLRFEIDDGKLQSKLKRIQLELGTKLGNEVFNSANYMKAQAKRLVPVDTGATQRGILSVVKIRTNDTTEAVVGFKTNPHPDRVGVRGYQGKEFNLPRWMTYSQKALSHPWNSGNPRFLLIARDLAKEKFDTDVRIAVNDILKK